MHIQTEEDMLQYTQQLNYLVVYPDGSKHFFKSLRDIEKAIAIDYTTISRKLSGKNSCICVARGSDYIFWIRKL